MPAIGDLGRGAPDLSLWNSHGSPYDLLVFFVPSEEAEWKVENRAVVRALVYGPGADLRVAGQGRLAFRHQPWIILTWGGVKLERQGCGVQRDANAPRRWYWAATSPVGRVLGITGKSCVARDAPRVHMPVRPENVPAIRFPGAVLGGILALGRPGGLARLSGAVLEALGVESGRPRFWSILWIPGVRVWGASKNFCVSLRP